MLAAMPAPTLRAAFIDVVGTANNSHIRPVTAIEASLSNWTG